MDPRDTAIRYNTLAAWWVEQMKDSTYGVTALERAITFVKTRTHALDVGCGGEGRFLRVLAEAGFHCSGLDISDRMIDLVSARHPECECAVGDICSWELPRRYDLITAWDSTFHLPLPLQAPVLIKLCNGLTPEGVLLFTCGGGEGAGSIEGEFGGQRFHYSTLGVPEFVRILWDQGCMLRHLEYDQHPQNHVYVVAQRVSDPPASDRCVRLR